MVENVGLPAVANLLSLEGQRALVTGGSGNIGRGIAARLAEAGADIVIHYHSDAAGAAQTAAAVTAIGRKADSLQADLTDADDVAALFGGIHETGPPASCIVNCARRDRKKLAGRSGQVAGKCAARKNGSSHRRRRRCIVPFEPRIALDQRRQPRGRWRHVDRVAVVKC